MDIRTATFGIPIRDVPVFKSAAKQLDLDLVVAPFEQGDEMASIHVLIVSDTQLVTLGFISGMEAMCSAMKNPMNDFLASMERKIEDFESKTDTND